MTENETAKIIVNTAYKIHSKLGPGLLESVYEEVLYYELAKINVSVRKQVPIPIIWNEQKLDIAFRADLIVDDKVIIEIKSVEMISPVHYKQLLTYLKISHLKLGLLINFGEEYIKDGIKRVVNKL